MRGNLLVTCLGAMAWVAGCGAAATESPNIEGTAAADAAVAEQGAAGAAEDDAATHCLVHVQTSRSGMRGGGTLLMRKGQVVVASVDAVAGRVLRMDGQPRTTEREEVCTVIARAVDGRWPDAALTYDGTSAVSHTLETDAGPMEFAISRAEPMTAEHADAAPSWENQRLYQVALDPGCEGRTPAFPRIMTLLHRSFQISGGVSEPTGDRFRDVHYSLTCVGHNDAADTAASCTCGPSADATGQAIAGSGCTVVARDGNLLTLSLPDSQTPVCVTVEVPALPR